MRIHLRGNDLLLTDKNAGTGPAFNYVGISQEPLNGASGNPTVTTNPAIPNLINLGQDNHEGYGRIALLQRRKNRVGNKRQ